MSELEKILNSRVIQAQKEWEELSHIRSLIIAHHKTVGVLETEVDFTIKQWNAECFTFSEAQDWLLCILINELSL